MDILKPRRLEELFSINTSDMQDMSLSIGESPLSKSEKDHLLSEFVSIIKGDRENRKMNIFDKTRFFFYFLNYLEKRIEYMDINDSYIFFYKIYHDYLSSFVNTYDDHRELTLFNYINLMKTLLYYNDFFFDKVFTSFNPNEFMNIVYKKTYSKEDLSNLINKIINYKETELYSMMKVLDSAYNLVRLDPNLSLIEYDINRGEYDIAVFLNFMINSDTTKLNIPNFIRLSYYSETKDYYKDQINKEIQDIYADK